MQRAVDVRSPPRAEGRAWCSRWRSPSWRRSCSSARRWPASSPPRSRSWALRSLGLTRRSELVVADLIRSSAVAGRGLLARRAGRRPVSLASDRCGQADRATIAGWRVDGPVLLGLGSSPWGRRAGRVVAARGVAPGVGAAGPRHDDVRSRIASRRHGRRLPPTIGMRMAFDRSPAARGRPAGRSRSAMAGHRGDGRGGRGPRELRRAQGTPDRIGQRWDASRRQLRHRLKGRGGLARSSERDGIEAVGRRAGLAATIDRRRHQRGRLPPRSSASSTRTFASGRAPRAVDEVRARRDRRLKSSVRRSGDRAAGGLGHASKASPEEVTVTGIGAVAGTGFEVDPGGSVLVSPEVARLDPDNSRLRAPDPVRGRCRSRALLAELRDRFPHTVWRRPVPSRSVQTLDGLRVPRWRWPWRCVLALAAVAPMNALVTSVRRRGASSRC